MEKKKIKNEKSKRSYIAYGFPFVSQDSEADKQKFSKKERGVSLLIAIMSIALMISFVSEMIISSNVNVEMSISSRDRMKAEYMAKSGFNLGVFLLSASYLWDHVQASGLIPGTKGQEISDGPSSLWSMLNGQALGASIASWLDVASSAKEGADLFNLKGFLNEDTASQMRLLEDQFIVNISDEKSKINISECEKSGARACERTVAQLESLFSCPPEKAFLESKNIDPKELAYRIKDFLSSSEQASHESNISSKDGPYDSEVPPYKAKRTFLDSLEELKLVKGWDDDIHKVFSPYLTIYPYHSGKNTRAEPSIETININTAPQELLVCLLPQAMKQDYREKAIQKLHEIKVKKGNNIASQSTEIGGKIKDIFGYDSADYTEGSVDPKDWFVIRSDVFRIVVDAETGNQKKKLTAVVRRVDGGVKDNWVEKREPKRSYQILYWKIM